MARIGRPKQDDDDNRTRQCNVRFTAAEHAQIQQQAEIAGVKSVSEYIRLRTVDKLDDDAIRKAQTAKADRRALITELSRVGNNVNQLARAAHTDRDICSASHLRFLRIWCCCRETGQPRGAQPVALAVEGSLERPNSHCDVRAAGVCQG